MDFTDFMDFYVDIAYYLIAGAMFSGLAILLLYAVRNRNHHYRTAEEEDDNNCSNHLSLTQVHITVALFWVPLVIPSINAAVSRLETDDCFTNTWKAKQCEVVDIKMTPCSSRAATQAGDPGIGPRGAQSVEAGDIAN